MKIALIGATGNIGTRIVTEALSRGHSVTGISRHADKLENRKNLTKKVGDVTDVAAMAKALSGHDAVIFSFTAPSREEFLKGGASAVEATKKAGVKRLLVVGGAGTMDATPGVALIDTPAFPEMFKPAAAPMREFYQSLSKEKDLDWTFLAPAVMIGPGERTGKFRTNPDMVLQGKDGGPSQISYEDYAVAMIDEAEKPKHIRRRFTLGY